MRGLGATRCLVAAALFGASAPAASALVGSLPALVAAGLLYIGAGMALTPAVLRRPPTLAALRQDRLAVAVAVLAGGAIAPVLLMVGLAHTSAATASLLLNLELVATVTLSAALFRDHLGRRVVAGSALVTAAGVVMVWQPGAHPSGGALAVVGACALWGLDNSVTARVDQLAPEHLVVAKGAVAGVSNTVLGVAVAGGVGGLRPADVGGALLIGALGYGASMVLWVKGARELGAARAQLVFATAPFIGVLVAWSVRGERLGWEHAVAIVLAGAGVALSVRSDHDHPHLHRALWHEHEHRHDDDHHLHRHGAGQPPGLRHTHRHGHEEQQSSHPHVPDLHHRHEHE
ncbi:MAG: DMT family transporter [Acidimicrobiales bacterium]|nr:DMT family transporter [Acidimicrobiales bacterium]